LQRATLTDRHWERWGTIDPYYGVLSDEKFSSSQIQNNMDEFFRSGASYVDGVLLRYEHLFGPIPEGRALDFGCGVGRLTLPLASRFGHAIGLDISDSMLGEARRNAETRGLSMVTFARSDDELSQAPGQFAFVNSVIVLQHIPVKRGLKLIEGLLSKVQPGGGAHIHVSIGRPFVRRFVSWIRHRLPGANLAYNVVTGRPRARPAMQMNVYPLARVGELHIRAGMAMGAFHFEHHGAALTVSLTSQKHPD
jgi:2-polyprenyl-3-methyl-5-hydroxy-6-metoxy-1,4-benzoquinol methylase